MMGFGALFTCLHGLANKEMEDQRCLDGHKLQSACRKEVRALKRPPLDILVWIGKALLIDRALRIALYAGIAGSMHSSFLPHACALSLLPMSARKNPSPMTDPSRSSSNHPSICPRTWNETSSCTGSLLTDSLDPPKKSSWPESDRHLFAAGRKRAKATKGAPNPCSA